MKHTRNLYVPCLDIDVLSGANTGTPDWKPIDLSTVFELAMNPNEETYAYIKDANDYSEITGYAMNMSQEIVMESDNPIYANMRPFMMSMPTGSSAKVPVLVVMPDMSTNAATVGYMWADATVSPQTINSVDGKLTFNLNLNGTPKQGTVAGVGTSTITFTPAP
jgi:hypothetical protein